MRRRYIVLGAILAGLAAAAGISLLVMTPDAPEHPGTDSCGYTATPEAKPAADGGSSGGA